MDKNQTFEEFLANQAPTISPWEFLINLALTAILAYILGVFYSRFGNTLSNKKMFASNFELMAVTTMIIITIVKSSLALSLGLVGALSIVRFRAAIKEPQELTYIFFTIAIGLGLGANQRLVTLIGFGFVLLVIWIKNSFKSMEMDKNLNFTILSEKPQNISVDSILKAITPFCKALELKRVDESRNFLEASFLVEFNNLSEFSQVRNALHELDESIQTSFMDHKGII